MSPYEYTPKPWKWSDLDGEQVTVRVIRSEGLEQVYLFHKDAIYLVSETTESVERPCPECSTDEMDVTHIKPRRNVFDEVSETTRNAEQACPECSTDTHDVIHTDLACSEAQDITSEGDKNG